MCRGYGGGGLDGGFVCVQWGFLGFLSSGGCSGGGRVCYECDGGGLASV